MRIVEQRVEFAVIALESRATLKAQQQERIRRPKSVNVAGKCGLRRRKKVGLPRFFPKQRENEPWK
jgi:hypothetical protein